jgi:hypothetical protein
MVAELDPSKPEQLGEFLHREWKEAVRAHHRERPNISAAEADRAKRPWSDLRPAERAVWQDVARATFRRFAAHTADVPGSVNEAG